MGLIEEVQQENEELHQVISELEQQNRQLEEKIMEIFTLYNVSKALSISYQLEDLLGVAVRMIGGSLEVDELGLYVIENKSPEDSSRQLVLKVYEGKNATNCSMILEIEKSNLIGDIFVRNESVQLFADGEYAYEDQSWLPVGKGSVLALPISVIGGTEPNGILVARSHGLAGFSKDDIRLFDSIAEHLAIALQNAEVFHRTQELSFVDPLTGIYNRRYFEERLSREISRAERYHRPFQLLLIDVDNFKNINDTRGHPFGDYVLQQIARILKEELRRSDVVARYGGDEFIVLLPESEGMASDKVMYKLRRALRGHDWNDFDARESGLGLTVGMASYPDDGLEAKELVEAADKELYEFKAKSKIRRGL